MDLSMVKVEQVVVREGTGESPVEMASDKAIIIKEPAATSFIQPYQHDNLQCFQCFITFCNSKAKERHMKKSHREEYKQQLQQSDTLFTCYVCDRTFPSSEELTEHQATHNKEDKPFKCPHCQESFRTFSELTSHRRQVCPERQCTCRDCGEAFKGISLLRTHRATHHPPHPEGEAGQEEDETKTHRCGKCGRGFQTEAELLQHQEKHAGDLHCNGSAPSKRRGRPPKTAEPVNEEKVGKRRKKAEEEAETEAVNQTGEETAGTAEKGKTGGRRGRPPKTADKAKAAPAQQEAAGPQSRPHPCPECESSFSTAAQLRAHKKEKHGRPPPPRKAHACKECEESFARPEQLEAHTSRAHGAGRHTCPTCGKSFGRENSLKAHRQTHTDDGETAEGGKR